MKPVRILPLLALLALMGCRMTATSPRHMLYVDVQAAATAWGLQVEPGAEATRCVLSDAENRVVLVPGMERILVNGDWVDGPAEVTVHEGLLILPAATVEQIRVQLRGYEAFTRPVVAATRVQPSPQPLKRVQAPAASVPVAVQLPAGVTARNPRAWKYIVIHHSDTVTGNAAIFDRYHRETNGWSNGLGYHFVIGNGSESGDGEIEIGGRWTRQIHGAHAGNNTYNQKGIGICLVGDFQTQQGASDKQQAALRSLCQELMRQFGISKERVIGHTDVPGKSTSCPGRNFDVAGFRAGL